MTKLLIATRNPGKLQRFQQLLSGFNLELVTLADVGITADIDETEETLEGNAVLKAKTYQGLSKLPVLSEDSGLMIDALNGWPGVHSRRVWGPQEREATDEEALQEVLKRMKNISVDKRGAKFAVVIALAMPDGTIHTAQGESQGSIAITPGIKKTVGFPYRSLFIRPGEQLPESELEDLDNNKESLSHRKQAIIKLAPYFKALENN